MFGFTNPCSFCGGGNLANRLCNLQSIDGHCMMIAASMWLRLAS
jgi:hypothetical protein